MALLGLSSSKLSSERNVPRVCPAINASRANPREQITGGRQGKSEREGGQTERERMEGKRPTETHRIALQLGREIALSTVRRPFRGDCGQLDSRRSWNRFVRPRDEGRGSLAFRRVLLLLFLLHLVPRREDPTSPISNRDFKGFREDYSVKVIIFEDTIASRSLILPIFFFFYRELYSLSVWKKLFDFIFGNGRYN